MPLPLQNRSKPPIARLQAQPSLALSRRSNNSSLRDSLLATPSKSASASSTSNVSSSAKPSSPPLNPSAKPNPPPKSTNSRTLPSREQVLIDLHIPGQTKIRQPQMQSPFGSTTGYPSQSKYNV
ncbi:hypothetical protein PCASD_12105 [Puccinia coronata f. sp. avenae]|uniref:Uncharacterized protein n=1 Tax=Puccinia coronata f. sp. avenae TaxID=200324 RepID=A0A2N5SD07_9BASI|nr:hypothetical protein PCASD_23839 [Puccinia coronata f. sp. avenae]PLW35906.1 hypothetical protein PCASD_12105 [Puccinia coronata f. sp. avenae]